MSASTAALTKQSGRRQAPRLQLACEPCRTGKLKCDRSLPVCNQCYKRSRDAACKYTERGLRHNVAAKRASYIKEKLKRFEQFVTGFRDSENDPVATSSVEAAPDLLVAAHDQPDEARLDAQMGSLRLTKSGSTHWVGPAHWESIIEDIADVKAYFDLEESLETTNSASPQSDLIEGTLSVNVNLGLPSVMSTADILARLPPRAELDRHVAGWFGLMHTARIIVHVPTFQQQYQQFWQNPSAVDRAWLAMMLVSAGLGAETAGQRLGDTNRLAQADSLRRLTEHAISPMTRPRPHLIEALVFYTLLLLIRQHDTDAYLWHIIGMALRLCHLAGYHRDPSNNPLFTDFEKEMRRRIWMVVTENDISIGHVLGTFSLTNSALCDTLPPSNYNDADISPEHCLEPRSREEYTLVLAEICYAQMAQLLSEAVILSQEVVAPPREVTSTLYARLVERRDSLPKVLRFNGIQEALLDTVPELSDRIRIELEYHTAVCTLHHRFLHDPSFDTERRRCLESAECIVDICVVTIEAATPDGKLASMKVVLTRHVHDFILAATLLCAELKRRSQTERGAINDQSVVRIRSKLLHACSLWLTVMILAPRSHAALNTITRFLYGEQPTPEPGADTEAAVTVPTASGSGSAGFSDFISSSIGDTHSQPILRDPMSHPIDESTTNLRTFMETLDQLQADDGPANWYWGSPQLTMALQPHEEDSQVLRIPELANHD